MSFARALGEDMLWCSSIARANDIARLVGFASALKTLMLLTVTLQYKLAKDNRRLFITTANLD